MPLRLATSRAQTPLANIMPMMQEIVQGLGVQCEYCHSAPRGSGQPEPKKDIARQMIAMTRDLNTRIQTATGKTAAETTQVRCVTCHRGVPIPKQLSEIVMQTLREKGAAAAAAQYRDLHEHFYGRAAYDFGEDTLVECRATAGSRSAGRRDRAAEAEPGVLSAVGQDVRGDRVRLHPQVRRPDRYHLLRKSCRARPETTELPADSSSN